LLIETKNFGKIEIEEKEIITFVEGILGFPEVERYILLGDKEEKNSFFWLQAVDYPELSFVVLEPGFFYPGFKPKLSQENLEVLGIEDQSSLLFYSITVVPEDVSQVRTNLQAPLVINTKNKKAKQIILNQPEYSLRHYLFQQLKGGTVNACADQKAK